MKFSTVVDIAKQLFNFKSNIMKNPSENHKETNNPKIGRKVADFWEELLLDLYRDDYPECRHPGLMDIID